jgi:rfaE bifunctional protein nucleotidyltransferase chain/domain
MIPVEGRERYISPKILTWDELAPVIAKLKAGGKTVGMCHGGFDLTHPGHALHFEAAKKACDFLVVSLTSDKFVTGRKGSGRPIYPDYLRAFITAKFDCVDFVTISDSKTALEPIAALKPSYYVKGPDFVHKQTPGITSERKAIADVGGSMVYTNEPALSTTAIIDYVQKEVKKTVLLGLDRDGTLILNDDFFGKEDDWDRILQVNDDLAAFLLYCQTACKTTSIVVTNQAGVARKYFTEERVQEINRRLAELLKKRGIRIDSWQYCPDVDKAYADQHSEIPWDLQHVKVPTKRKPQPTMLLDGLAALGKSLEDFDKVIIVGDREEDRALAQGINATFVDARASFADFLQALR